MYYLYHEPSRGAQLTKSVGSEKNWPQLYIVYRTFVTVEFFLWNLLHWVYGEE